METVSRESSMVDFDDEETCGCHVPYTCGGKPKTHPIRILQRFAKPHWALGLFSSVGFLQGFVVSGMINIVLTTIEKRFGLSSSESGFILSSYNIASCVVIPIVSYVGGRGHKPLWVGWGMATMGVGCLLFASPRFIADKYEISEFNETSEFLCSVNETLVMSSSTLNYFKYIFILAHVLNGCGTAALLTLGITYLDENVEQKMSSVYQGVYFAVAASFGPASGFVIGGLTLKLFTVIEESPDISSGDSAWVGAWWLGFIACGILLLLLSVPILFLPPAMPHTKQVRVDRSNEMHVNRIAKIADKDDTFGSTVKDLPKSIFLLLRNPAFIFSSFANAIDFGLIAGLSAFTLKYLESMFGITPTEAAYYLGMVVILGGSLGYICGGVIVSKAELTVRGMIKFCLINTVVAMAVSFIYIYTCPNIDFSGATTPYFNSSVLSSTEFASRCNSDCACSTSSYQPVCGDDGLTYFSPCFAGCAQLINGTYSNCSCIESESSTAQYGKCPNADCVGFPGFMVGLFFVLFFTLLCWTPVFQIVVRVVPFKERSFAVGATWVINRCFGGIPLPILFGSVYDLACAVWSGDESQGSCRLYFNHEMSRYTLYIIVTSKCISFVCFLLGLFLYRPPNASPQSPLAPTSSVQVLKDAISEQESNPNHLTSN